MAEAFLFLSCCVALHPTYPVWNLKPPLEISAISRFAKHRFPFRFAMLSNGATFENRALPAQDDTHIFAEWRLQGYLKFPWHPYVKPYTGTTLYTLDSDGFITRHEETWSITALDAARATITPTAGPQPKTTS